MDIAVLLFLRQAFAGDHHTALGTARLCGCDKNTVLEVIKTIGEKCERFHDEVVRHVKTESIQLDELWARVGVRQSRTNERDTERGDFYTLLALDRRTKLASFHSGKITREKLIAESGQSRGRKTLPLKTRWAY